jgi:hypothetical protein
MTMNRELLLDFAELSHLSIPCKKCQTAVVLDCMNDEARIPNECPGCGEEYSENFRTTLRAYRDVYRKLADPQSRSVQVRICASATT